MRSSRLSPKLVLLNVPLLVVTLFPVHAFADQHVFDPFDTEAGIGLAENEDGLGQVDGLVWVDANGDGIRQDDEDPLPGVEVVLFDSQDGEVETVVSDDAGGFVFGDVEPGEYVLRAPLPDGFEATVVVTPDDDTETTNSFTTTEDDGSVVETGLFDVEAGDEVNFHLGLTPIRDTDEAGDDTTIETDHPDTENTETDQSENVDIEETDSGEGVEAEEESEIEAFEAEDEEPVIAPLSVSPPGTYILTIPDSDLGAFDPVFYAYVEAGETLDLVFTKSHTGAANQQGIVVTVDGPGGVTASCELQEPAGDGDTCELNGLTSTESGIWRIDPAPDVEGLANTAHNRYAWQIDVSDGGGVIDGRVWTDQYIMQQLAAETIDSFTFWYQTEHGYTYQATYGGFNGINSIFQADGTGVRFNDTCTSAYASIVVSAQVGETPDPDRSFPELGECGDPYKIFFETPAPDLPASAIRWDGSTHWILPPIADPEITSVTFTPDGSPVHSGTVDYTVDNFTGQLVVEIDTNNDGSFDVVIPGSAINGAGSVDFDGLDGNGDPVPAFQEMAVRVSITQTGEIHFVNIDVELRDGGIEVIRLNGPGSPDPTIYWDDTDLSTTAPCGNWDPLLDGTGGVDSTGGVHWWDVNGCGGITGGWGDARAIDEWTFVPVDESMQILVPAQVLPTFACTADGILGQGAPTTFFSINLVSGESTELFEADHDWNINAFGYNVLDDYIYGYVPTAGENQIVRVGSDGTVVELGRPAGIPEGNLNTGDIDEEGYLWLSSQAAGGIGWFKVDVIPGSATYLEVVDSGPVVGYDGTFGGPDWAYVPGGGDYLYRINRSPANDEAFLFRFDRQTHVHELLGSLGDLGGSNVFGAVYADADGFLYGSNNHTGQIWRIDVHSVTASLFADGPDSTSNDGAMCINATIYTDYGDAPESYGTLLADDGPRHSLRDYDPDTNTTSLMLGQGVSHETDGQPSAGADADTFDDGVASQIVMVIGQDTEVEVFVTNNTDQPATLAGWIDLDVSGTFDAGELEWDVVPPGFVGTVTLTWPAPALPGVGTYARFRLFPGELDEGDLSPTGPASAGEVEDYPVVGPVSVHLQCPIVYAQQGGSPYNIYEVDTSTGDMTVVGQFASGSGTNNGLGISADARYFFGHRNGQVLRFDSQTGITDTFAGVPGLNSTHGGVDPQSGIYYYGNIATGVFAFDPATETNLGQVATLSFDIAPAGTNGDWSFDAQGNLYVVAGSATNSSLYVVSGMSTTSQPTPVALTGQRITTFSTGGAAVNGAAFDATGSLYVASNAIIFEIDPATGDILDQQSLSPSGVSVDLASCSTPPSIVVQKDIAERFNPGDQFEVTVTGGGITENNTGTTTGTDTGLQDAPGEFAGPVLGRPGTTYDIAETGVSGADLSNYTTSWVCVNLTADGAVVAEGTGSSGSFVMPETIDGIGAAIVCTFLNEPTGYTVAKTADPPPGTTLRPGDTVTYTLTLTNVGTVDLFDVEADDDLSGVLDDAELTSGPVVAPIGAGSAIIDGDILSFVGDLPAGEQVAVTYTVTVLETSEADGDGILTNAVTSPDAVNCPDPAVTDPQDPEFDPDCVTVHPVRDVTIVKSSDPGDGTTVAPGDTVTYTLEITNTGGYDYTLADPAEASDDLSGVIDDAIYNNDADSGGVGTLTYTAPVLTWTGPLAAGDVVTITYTVTVLATESLGDAVLENVVTGTDSNCPDPAVTDPDDPDYDPDCHNRLPVGAVHYLKTVDPEDPLALQPGDPFTYTVTVSNIGAVDLEGLTFTDDLSDVLDDATFEVGSETADIGTAVFDGTDAVEWSGDLDVGQVATITYTVTIDSPPGGNSILINGVLGTGPGSNCPPPGPATHADCFKQIPQPLINTVKTSDAVGEVEPGDIVEYEFTVSNDGTGPARIFEVRDHLVGVLDDATYNGDLALVSGPGGVVFDPVNQEIVWTGELDVGEGATVAYSVTVNAADELGDGVLRNAVTSPDCFSPPTFDPDDPLYDPDCVTEDPIRAWTGEKTSDVVGNVEPGDTVTYTITVENTGGADITDIGFTDDLSDVLDDATFNPGSVDAPFGDVSFDPVAAEFTWEINAPDVLAVGQSVVITYSVTVNDADEMGNGVLVNAITGPMNCPDPAVTDPQDPDFNPDCVTISDIEAWTVVKDSDASDPALPGDVITYTLTVTNTGNVALDAADVLVEDDLTDVLDDAAYNGDADQGAAFTDPVISWSDDLAVGQVVTITYSVTVNPASELGDGILVNAVTGGDCPAPAIADPQDPDFDPDCVTISDILAWTVVKVSDAATPVLPGDVITYTVTVTNTGNVALTEPAVWPSIEDDLSEVLDDASYNGDEAATSGTVSYGEPTVSWEGPLAVGGVVTITYSVTVNDSSDLGDGQLVNAVTGGDCPDPAITDPLDPDFDPTCVVIHDIEAWSVVKTSDASDPVLPGDVITYTLTVTNTGNVDLMAENVIVSDDLSAVVDDATFDDDVSATSGIATYLAPILSWTGDLAVGQVVTVTYSVTVNPASELGDGILVNSVTGGDCPDPAITDPQDPDFDPDCVTISDIEAWTVVKDSDASDPALPGDVITYTLTVTNTGNVALAAADVLVEDDLTDVLDDAAYNGDVDQGAVFTDPVISWSDDLAVSQVVTITYSVTVNDADSLGDGVLVNAVTGGDCPDPAIIDPSDPDFDPTCVNITDVAAYTVAKTSDASQFVLPGDVITYSVVVTNTGGADVAGASFSDDLSGVLDDATYNGDADQGAVFADPVLSWTGDLDVGDAVTVTYSVTVDQPIGGDHQLVNAIVGGDCPDPAVTDPEDPGFDPTCVVVDPLPGVEITKVVVGDPEPGPGDSLEYVVTVTNIGQVDLADESFTDDLSEVLDDATLDESSISADIGTATFTDPTLSWVGDLAVGEVATIRYTVVIDDPLTGDGEIRNVVVGSVYSNCVPPDPDDPACWQETPVPNVYVSKELVGPENPQPGDVVTYRITVENRGGAVATAEEVTDDLSGMLDDAAYNNDATAGSGTVSYGEPILTWVGDVPAGEAVTITYSVTVNAYGDLGDAILENTVTGGENCPGADECTTTNPLPTYEAVKTAVAPSEVEPGDIVAYQVTITNTSTVTAEEALVTDDLTGVLDDAAYNGDASASSGSITYSEPILTWTGTLAAGEVATFNYSVTVNPADQLGDGVLENVIAAPNCVDHADLATLSHESCFTLNEVAAVEYNKTIVSPEGNISGGDIVTYQITVSNIGAADLTGLEVTDNLSAVLEHATFRFDQVASVGVANYQFETLTWTGDLAAGQSATVTYSVRLDLDAPTGAALDNIVVGSGPGSNCPPGSSNGDCLATMQVSASGLPFTGADLVYLIVAAMAMLALGVLTVITTRRRRHS